MRIGRIVGPFAKRALGVDSKPATLRMMPYIVVMDIIMQNMWQPLGVK